MHLHKNPFKRFRGDHTIAVFDNPGQFVKMLDDQNSIHKMNNEMKYEPSFYSGETWQDMKNKSVDGDKDTAQKAARLMAAIDAVSKPTLKRQRIASPYGRVSVGAYLASDPQPCRRKVAMPRDDAPLSIVVSLNSMAGVDASDLHKRGVAIAALARRIAAARPLSLYLSRFSACGGINSGMLVKFPTTPIDVYRLAYLLSSQGFARGAGFAFHKLGGQLARQAGHTRAPDVSNCYDIMFAGGTTYSQSRHCAYALDLGEFLNTELLYIPGSDPANKDFNKMVSNPVEWINETMAELTKR